MADEKQWHDLSLKLTIQNGFKIGAGWIAQREGDENILREAEAYVLRHYGGAMVPHPRFHEFKRGEGWVEKEHK